MQRSDDPFLTVAEIAEHWRVSKMTVYRLLDSGKLPFVRVGRSYRVRRSIVERYLQINGSTDGS